MCTQRFLDISLSTSRLQLQSTFKTPHIFHTTYQTKLFSFYGFFDIKYTSLGKRSGLCPRETAQKLLRYMVNAIQVKLVVHTLADFLALFATLHLLRLCFYTYYDCKFKIWIAVVCCNQFSGDLQRGKDLKCCLVAILLPSFSFGQLCYHSSSMEQWFSNLYCPRQPNSQGIPCLYPFKRASLACMAFSNCWIVLVIMYGCSNISRQTSAGQVATLFESPWHRL